MSAAPAILGAALLGGVLLYASRSKAAAAADDEPEVTGEEWETVFVKEANGQRFFDVFARAGAFGPHARMKVIRYKETPQGRVLVTQVQNVPSEMLAAAREDFGLIRAPIQE